jgi:hypothetical protein
VTQAPVEAVPAADPERIRRLYAPQFEAADALLDTVWTHLPEGFDHDDGNDVWLLLLHLLGRATQSYRAVLSLCGLGLPDQAYMICRSLYEDMIATHWARLEGNRGGLFEKVVRQERHWDERRDRVLREYGTRVERPGEGPMREEEWNELDEEFSGGTKSWFGRLATAEEQVIKSIDDSEELKALQLLSETHHDAANMTLHNTVEGLITGASRPLRYKDRFYFSYEEWRTPNEFRMQRSFFNASECYSKIATQALTEFSVDTTEVSEAVARMRFALFELLPSDRRKLGPNDRCWCESGLKLKKCHEV